MVAVEYFFHFANAGRWERQSFPSQRTIQNAFLTPHPCLRKALHGINECTRSAIRTVAFWGAPVQLGSSAGEVGRKGGLSSSFISDCLMLAYTSWRIDWPSWWEMKLRKCMQTIHLNVVWRLSYGSLKAEIRPTKDCVLNRYQIIQIPSS